ncbi:molybdopterin-dependent oxidoreductase [Hymenobacter sp. BT523]|uniref:molybdopterin-dependent oxidoreductase n=1 Tax=Hymenobacter sp. BT523 TaxID=2795725 RepID=UPI0018ECD603|nr:molybdopterin-dependent oxidoreductase [Hymenobacter sp. BT523]MBJ6109855.1 molybdopterin-dependent oxidoreductase [Hymenobacter sp. BT523]
MSEESPVPAPAENSQAPLRPEAEVLAEARRRSRRSFIGLGLAGLAGLGGWKWLISQPEDDGIPRPLRQVLDANGRLSHAYYKQTRLAPEFASTRARTPRKNGTYGLKTELDPATWRMRVQGYGTEKVQEFTLADVQALPKVDMVTELKCIEGWSVVVHWAGARLSDFLAKYPLATRSGQPFDPRNPPADLAPYAGLATPDGNYYVGLDMDTVLHPQTLLCYEMNGKPLTPEHGAPLRLVTPLKYGIKHLKRIGTMTFADARPKDLWAEMGYDWDSGH